MCVVWSHSSLMSWPCQPAQDLHLTLASNSGARQLPLKLRQQQGRTGSRGKDYIQRACIWHAIPATVGPDSYVPSCACKSIIAEQNRQSNIDVWDFMRVLSNLSRDSAAIAVWDAVARIAAVPAGQNRQSRRWACIQRASKGHAA